MELFYLNNIIMFFTYFDKNIVRWYFLDDLYNQSHIFLMICIERNTAYNVLKFWIAVLSVEDLQPFFGNHEKVVTSNLVRILLSDCFQYFRPRLADIAVEIRNFQVNR